ncbi:MAG: hypothetical protein AAB966_03880, partial [Patescibacteria group bacterium]
MFSKRLLLFVGVPLFVISVVGSYFFFSSKNAGKAARKAKYQAAVSSGQLEVIDEGPKTAECPLNGKMYTQAQKEIWESRRPLGVAIENHLDARPQSGL